MRDIPGQRQQLVLRGLGQHVLERDIQRPGHLAKPYLHVSHPATLSTDPDNTRHARSSQSRVPALTPRLVRRRTYETGTTTPGGS